MIHLDFAINPEIEQVWACQTNYSSRLVYFGHRWSMRPLEYRKHFFSCSRSWAWSRILTTSRGVMKSETIMAPAQDEAICCLSEISCVMSMSSFYWPSWAKACWYFCFSSWNDGCWLIRINHIWHFSVYLLFFEHFQVFLFDSLTFLVLLNASFHFFIFRSLRRHVNQISKIDKQSSSNLRVMDKANDTHAKHRWQGQSDATG